SALLSWFELLGLSDARGCKRINKFSVGIPGQERVTSRKINVGVHEMVCSRGGKIILRSQVQQVSGVVWQVRITDTQCEVNKTGSR
ncbi:MAG TPA: hypothetical protein VIX17_15785, partial [Pyrinomonadaceae bacterium]